MTTSAQGRANRNRGARAELQVVKYLRANGYPDARRTLAGDGRQPGDIDFAPGIHLEVKDVASSAWPTWRAQAVRECRGRIPIVVRRTRGVTNVGKWTCHWSPLLGGDSWNDVWCSRSGHMWHVGTFINTLEALQSDSERTT